MGVSCELRGARLPGRRVITEHGTAAACPESGVQKLDQALGDGHLSLTGAAGGPPGLQ